MLSHQAVRAELVTRAKAQQPITYGELGAQFGLDMSDPGQRMELVRALDAINRAEHAAGRPLLSAVVVQKESQVPGSGYFDLARELLKLSGSDSDAELAFYIKELQEVYATPWP